MSKIIFLGTPLFALPILKSLIKKKYNVLAVFSQPPSKSKRGQNTLKSPIQVFCEELKMEVRTPSKISDDKQYIKS